MMWENHSQRLAGQWGGLKLHLHLSVYLHAQLSHPYVIVVFTLTIAGDLEITEKASAQLLTSVSSMWGWFALLMMQFLPHFLSSAPHHFSRMGYYVIMCQTTTLFACVNEIDGRRRMQVEPVNIYHYYIM